MTISPTVEKKGRIINLTHQIPYEITLDDGSWEFTPRRGHGAMYGGIHSLQKSWDVLHIGWTGLINKNDESIVEDLSETEKNELYNQLKENHSCLPLFVDSESVSGHYDGYCKTSKVKLSFDVYIYM